jgi:hypothetical protein
VNILNKDPVYLPGPQGGNSLLPPHHLPLQRPLAPRKLWLPSVKSSEHELGRHFLKPCPASQLRIAAGAQRWLH